MVYKIINVALKVRKYGNRDIYGILFIQSEIFCTGCEVPEMP